MQPLFSEAGTQALNEVLRHRPLLAFDFDGTIAPIVARPELARVPQAWGEAMAELAGLHPVAIITGRAVADVKTKLPFTPHYIIGNHGAEDPAGVLPSGSIERLEPVRSLLRRYAARWHPLGIEVEDKHYSLALHYRLAPDQLAAERCVDELMCGMEEGLHIFRGKCVMNVAPDDAPDKADAVASLVRRSGTGAALFVGDDLNDEPVFTKAPANWLTVKVGGDAMRSRARFFVDEHGDVGRLLEHLVLSCRGRAGG